MKKSIIKNVIALTFALGALVFVAGNVYAEPPECSEEQDFYENVDGVTKKYYCWTELESGILPYRICGTKYPNRNPQYDCADPIWFQYPKYPTATRHQCKPV